MEHNFKFSIRKCRSFRRQLKCDNKRKKITKHFDWAEKTAQERDREIYGGQPSPKDPNYVRYINLKLQTAVLQAKVHISLSMHISWNGRTLLFRLKRSSANMWMTHWSVDILWWCKSCRCQFANQRPRSILSNNAAEMFGMLCWCGARDRVQHNEGVQQIHFEPFANLEE